MSIHQLEFQIKGRIVRIESKDNYVLCENDNLVRCNLPGKFKKLYKLKRDKLSKVDITAIGDFVEIDMNEDGSGSIKSIEERTNILSRKAPKIKGVSKRGERLEQVIGVNLENLIVVSSINRPIFNNKVVDRIIVAGESAKMHVKIIINKIDLDEYDEAELWQEFYEDLGYSVYLTNAKKGIGLAELEKDIENSVSVFWGPSGVGKSSILNKLYPELNFKVGEISDYSQKGQHTTVTSIMQKVGENTYVIDTPGIREIDPFGIMKHDLGHYFTEFSDYIHDCKFNTCTHHHEPGCAVIEAVENEEIAVERYESYLNMLETIEDDMIFKS